MTPQVRDCIIVGGNVVLADTMLSVQSARETLENAIRMVEADDKWKARVVYGDTDSMFVLLPGRCACLCSTPFADCCQCQL